MRHTKHNLGKAIAAVALALLMVVQVAPAAALAQQDGEQKVLTAASSGSAVKGKGWKLTLPNYWRGKVKAAKRSYGTGFDIVSIKGKSKGLTLACISEENASTFKSYSTPTGKKVKLKNGKKAKVVSLQTRSYYSRGAEGFFVKTKTGKYLLVSVYPPYTGTMGSLPGKAKLGHFAKLQSLGKTSKYGSGSQLACLQAIAKSLSY